MAESEEELKILLNLKESERAELKESIRKTNIIASSPIIAWQREGKKESTDRLPPLGLSNRRDGDRTMKSEYYCFLARKLWQT